MKPHSTTRSAALLALLLLVSGIQMHSATRKTSRPRVVYMTYILHGNMNYDRYVRPTIWKEFPVIYDNLMDFMDEHPDFCGQMQLSGQTLNSLRQAAPQVIQHALEIHRRGQLNFTGTFYSEPVNVNMDGETNYRCAWLGTRIVESITGEKTDGFYLQERAYHPQMPYILEHADVTWTPIITNDDSWRPFRLRGLDGSLSVCLPVTRGDFIERVIKAPAKSLITLEEDYEIPQAFTTAYDKAAHFNRSQDSVRIEWITAKEYIRRFGVGEEKFVDHSAKARNRDNGTYSRWTADPLDIQLQQQTNQAMDDLRAAKIIDALCRHLWNAEADQPIDSADLTLTQDPLTWNIERADLYPDVEPKFLARRGSVTLLSRAEHLLLWGVNSDSKGWYPLYEKRRERTQSLQHSSGLSRHVIGRAMDLLASQLQATGYDKYFLAVNTEQARTHAITLHTDLPYELYDCSTGEPLHAFTVRQRDECLIEAEVPLPAYGYVLIGGRRRPQADMPAWEHVNHIANAYLDLTADDASVSIRTADGQHVSITLDTFMIRPLAEVTSGRGDEEWRSARPFGPVRIRACHSGLHPQLQIECQPDWLLHMSQTFTLLDDHIVLDIDFHFPHPTLLRKTGPTKGNTFNPEGLSLIFDTHVPGTAAYDIPYGISEYTKPGLSYFCPLSALWLQHGSQGGFAVSPQTGEQAFCADLDKGTMTLYMGASTTSGPIRNVGLTYKKKNDVSHEEAWYSEPFHGSYHHRILLIPYGGTWQEAHLPQTLRSVHQPVYTRECHPAKGPLPARESLITTESPNVDITTIDDGSQGLVLRLNEREGRPTKTTLRLRGQEYKAALKPYGIVTLPLKP